MKVTAVDKIDMNVTELLKWNTARSYVEQKSKQKWFSSKQHKGFGMPVTFSPFVTVFF